MNEKEYLLKSGLTELNNPGLDNVAISRQLESAYLDFLKSLADKADPRWLAITKTHIEEGGMAVRKAIASFKANQME